MREAPGWVDGPLLVRVTARAGLGGVAAALVSGVVAGVNDGARVAAAVSVVAALAGASAVVQRWAVERARRGLLRPGRAAAAAAAGGATLALMALLQAGTILVSDGLWFDAQAAAIGKLLGPRSAAQLSTDVLLLLAAAIALGGPVSGLALDELDQGEPVASDRGRPSLGWLAASVVVAATLLLLATVSRALRPDVPLALWAVFVGFGAFVAVVAVVGSVTVAESLTGGLLVALLPPSWTRRDRPREE